MNQQQREEMEGISNRVTPFLHFVFNCTTWATAAGIATFYYTGSVGWSVGAFVGSWFALKIATDSF